ncbi:MAG: hypothetical protein CMP22_00675 [Rickettsiales bacterium]|nr:hypothetical protein [Rickettsiales bacterium]|tara:strand:+ start:927 stop:1397 length:471 start_codon:yes stop_codon:yes gene_type:complete
MHDDDKKLRTLLDQYEVPEISRSFDNRLSSAIDRTYEDKPQVRQQPSLWFDLRIPVYVMACLMLVFVGGYYYYSAGFQPSNPNGVKVTVNQTAEETNPALDYAIANAQTDRFVDELYSPIIASLQEDLKETEEGGEVDLFIDEIFLGEDIYESDYL